MPITKIPLIGVSDTGRSPDINSHRAINLMPQSGVGGAKDSLYWVATPGNVEFATAQYAPQYLLGKGRITDSSGIVTGDEIYYTRYQPATGSGTLTLYTLEGTGTDTSLGSLGSLEGGVGIAVNDPPYESKWLDMNDFFFFTQTRYCYAYDHAATARGRKSAATNRFSIVCDTSVEYAIDSIVFTSGTTYTVTTSANLDSAVVDGNYVVFKGTGVFSDREYDINVTSANTFTISHINGTDAFTATADSYAYVRGDELTAVVGFLSCTYMDSYAITNTRDEFYVSYPNDPRIFLATNTGGANRFADKIMAVHAQNGILYLLGEQSIETYYNGGQGTQPFIPSRPVAFDWGLVDLKSLAQVSGGFICVGQKPNGTADVIFCDPNEIRPLANYALAQVLNTVELGAYYGTAYMLEGREYYCLTIYDETPTYVGTWVIDLTTTGRIGVAAWHERTQRPLRLVTANTPILDGSPTASRTKYLVVHDAVAGATLVSPSATTATYEVGDTAPDPIDRIGYSGHIAMNGMGLVHHSVFIDMENPVGTGTVTLQWSDDGGNTYNTGVSQSFTGRGTRVEFFGLGYARYDRVYKLTFNDCTVPINVIGAYVNVEPCSL